MTNNKTIKEIFKEIDISGDIETKCNKFRYRLNASEYVYLCKKTNNAKRTRKLILLTFKDRYTLLYSTGFFIGIVDNHDKNYYIESVKLNILENNNFKITPFIENYLNTENIVKNEIANFTKLNIITIYDPLYKTLANWDRPKDFSKIMQKIKNEFNNVITNLKADLYSITGATYVNKKVDSIYVFIKGVQYRISTHEKFYKTDQISEMGDIPSKTIIVNSRFDIMNKVAELKNEKTL